MRFWARALNPKPKSRFFMRRIVREPLTPSETATVAVAFSDLRALRSEGVSGLGLGFRV